MDINRNYRRITELNLSLKFFLPLKHKLYIYIYIQ